MDIAVRHPYGLNEDYKCLIVCRQCKTEHWRVRGENECGITCTGEVEVLLWAYSPEYLPAPY